MNNTAIREPVTIMYPDDEGKNIKMYQMTWINIRLTTPNAIFISLWDDVSEINYTHTGECDFLYWYQDVIKYQNATCNIRMWDDLLR